MPQLRTVILICGLTVLASCGGVLDPKGPVAEAQRLILYDATTIMLAVIVPVILLTLAFAWWFRAGNPRARYRPDWDYSGRIEIITWSIPALLICFLGGMAWIGSHRLDPPRPLNSEVTPLEVQVVALDWRWLFIYPDQSVASVDRLTVPVGVPVHFRLTSSSVMNSFFIPQLGSQIYAMPGMTTQLNLQADHIGTYQGLSAQFSGQNFSDMRFNVVVVSPDEFQEWVRGVRLDGGTLDPDTYAVLARPAKASGESTFGEVARGLFDHVSGEPGFMHEGHHNAR